MKRALFLILLCCSAAAAPAQTAARQQGILVRMRLAPCPNPQHALMMALSGAARPALEEPCPEYTLVTDKVVYVIVGKASTQLVPLAEITRFRFQNKEMLIRIDDADRETHFTVREMVLRPEWDRAQQREQQEMRAVASHEQDGAMLVRNQQ